MYVELHARSAFSFLEGASAPEELASRCAEHGMPAVALLDRDGVYGAPRLHLAAKKISVRAHIGAEVTSPEGWRYPLLAESREGYQNLCRLLTRMKMRARKGEGHILPGELAEGASGLVCLTGGEEGPLAHALARGGSEAGFECVQQLSQLFGRDNIYVELQRHFNRAEEARNQAAFEIARKLHLPLLATNGVCHAQPQQSEVLDAFTCIRHHRTLATAGRLLTGNAERHFKSPAQMAQLFADLPEAIANTAILSDRLRFNLEDLGYEFPKYPVPDGKSQMQFLRERTFEGMRTRYGASGEANVERARKQIERELSIIEKLDLPGYFLIVWDIVRFCREQNILVQGRGSAANSAVCYALGITAVDPVGMELLFERFLSEERGEWPDIDLDLPSGDQRERAIQYVYQRYGQLGAAMTANVITYRGRSAAHEIGKVLAFEPETLNRLTSLVGNWEYRDENDTLDRKFNEAGLDLGHPLIRKFFELCQQVQDLPRHLGQHSGGMVICQGQLDSVVPLEPATMPGRVVVQWDKEDCADMGIVKVDLLGLGMMAVLEESLQIIQGSTGEEIDLGRLPADDPTVYKALQKADTVGMFQIESRAQMSCLPRLKPTRFYDIVVQVAIIRPGPIVGKMVNPYLKRRQGREEVRYAHPSLEPVLKRTLGVPLFQEQLLRMAMCVANFTGGEAEELRRAMGFKRSEKRMKQIEKKLRRGMEQNGIGLKAQEEILQSICSFALYGFPESHAASFALLAYASAYLKCHHLAAFTAAMLNNQPMGFYSPATLVKDAQRHGLKIKPIDLTCSNWLCKLEALPQKSKDVEGETSGVCVTKSGSDRGSGLQSLCDSSGGQLLSAPQGATELSPARQRWEKTSNSPEPQQGRHKANRRTGDTGPETLVATPTLQPQHKGTVFSGPSGPEVKFEPGHTHSPGQNFAVRLGLRYVKGLRAEIAEELVRQRGLSPFACIEDIKLRVPAIQKDELAALAAIGALNQIGGAPNSNAHAMHRRDALWQVERAARRPGPLLEAAETPADSNRTESSAASPLLPMTAEERLVADFRGTGMTTGPHPMAYHRADLKRQGIRSAIELPALADGTWVRVAGAVIARQRPGTAKGFVFLSLEDETGIANAIIVPQLFAREHATLVGASFLLVEGPLQNLDNVISVKAERVQPIFLTRAETVSHDFH